MRTVPVHSRERIIKHIDVRIHVTSAGEAKSRSLTTTQADATLTNDCVMTILKRIDIRLQTACFNNLQISMGSCQQNSYLACLIN